MSDWIDARTVSEWRQVWVALLFAFILIAVLGVISAVGNSWIKDRFADLEARVSELEK